MAHGEKKAKVTAAFEKRILDLRITAQQTAEYFKTIGGKNRPWATPGGVKNTLDVAGLHAGTWDRNEINQIYCRDVLTGEVKSAGTCGDLIALNWQADFMSVEERAFRLRHASYARCAAMAHGKLKKHGDAEKSIFITLKKGVQTVIDAGGTTG